MWLLFRFLFTVQFSCSSVVRYGSKMLLVIIGSGVCSVREDSYIV
jgi:hypothetical protein